MQYFYYAKGAYMSRSSRTFLFEAYGANPIVFATKNTGNLERKGKLLDFGLSILILSVVLLAKITGSIVALIQTEHNSANRQQKGEAYQFGSP